MGKTMIFMAAAVFAAASASAAVAASKKPTVSFAEDVQPILQIRCQSCHQPGGDGYEKSGLDLRSYDGLMKGTKFGPIVQPATDPLYLDIALAHGASWAFDLPAGHNAFAYAYEGAATVGEGDDARALEMQELAVLGGGERLLLRAGQQALRMILVAGRPLREPVAKYGPFVMNTKQELMQAFVDFQEGRF